ncbi:hypothetical protein TcWFU_005034 [Taenia crassiceps]|uniref:Uncharacterized protein n=1 Tax=Taenia crassiceps TaxID=6207 RepID=A0ABR4QL82_9CEST
MPKSEVGVVSEPRLLRGLSHCAVAAAPCLGVSNLAGHHLTSFGYKKDLDPQSQLSTTGSTDQFRKHRLVLRSLFKGTSSGGKSVALGEQQPTHQAGSSSHRRYHIHHYPHHPPDGRRPLRVLRSPHMSSSPQSASALSSLNSSTSPGSRVSTFHAGLREEAVELGGDSLTPQSRRICDSTESQLSLSLKCLVLFESSVFHALSRLTIADLRSQRAPERNLTSQSKTYLANCSLLIGKSVNRILATPAWCHHHISTDSTLSVMRAGALHHQRSRSDGGVTDLVVHNSNPNADVEMDGENFFSIGDSNVPLGSHELALSTATAATTSSSNFVHHLLSVLFAGMTPPEPIFVKALVNNPPFGFFSRFPTATAAVVDPITLGLAFEYNLNHRSSRGISSTVRSGLERLFSPMRKKSRQRFRPSTASLPAQMVVMTADCATRDEHWLSMVQLAAESPAQPPPSPATSNVGTTERTASEDSKTAGTEVPVEESGTDVQPVPAPTTNAIVEDKVQIGRLRKEEQRLEADIRNIESRKSELNDWFLEQMLVPAGDDGTLRGGGEEGGLPEGAIKRLYKRRKAELNQRQAELEALRSEKRLVISHLEGQHTNEADGRANKTLSSSSSTAPATPPPRLTKSSKQPSTVTAVEEIDTSVSLTLATPSIPTGDSQSMTSHRHRQQEVDKRQELLSSPTLPPSKPGSSSPSNNSTKIEAPLPSLPSKPMRSHTLPVLQPPTMASESTIAAVTARPIKPLHPSTSSLGAPGNHRPVSGCSDQFSPTHFFVDDPGPSQQSQSTSTTTSQPSKRRSTSAKKSLISARRAFKHGFELFTKPFGRKSEVHHVSSRPTLKKSASEEHLRTTTAFTTFNDASSKPKKVPSTLNAWAMSTNAGASTSSKWKKSNKQGGGGTDHLSHWEVNANSIKKSHTGSISSRLSQQQHQQPHQQQMGESGATSGTGSERSGVVGSSSSPPHLLQSSGQHAKESSTANTALSKVFDVVDVLYGGSAGSGAALFGLQKGSLGIPLVASSGGASTHSGGNGAAATATNGPPTVGMGLAGGVSGGGLQLSPSTSSSPPSAYNVAMALVMLHQRIQALLEAHAEVQQKLTSEIREELGILRLDLTETRNIVNSITVEVEALRRDMQTKEEVQNQKLVDAVARLEQLDASAEKLRQNVQQDLIVIRNEQKHALEPLNYQLATETRDLRDMFTTLSNKVMILEKCERLLNLDRDQPQMLRSIANTLTDLVVSLVAFVTTLIQMLIRFLNAGATVTNNRGSAIALNVCLLVFLLVVFLAEPLVRWWNRTDSPVQQPPR